jgi:hypothetical protein
MRINTQHEVKTLLVGAGGEMNQALYAHMNK